MIKIWCRINYNKIIINQNIASLKQSPALLINEKVKELRTKGEKISHFDFGQSPFPIHLSIVAALRQNAENNHYLRVSGLEELREEIVFFYKSIKILKLQKRLFLLDQEVKNYYTSLF